MTTPSRQRGGTALPAHGRIAVCLLALTVSGLAVWLLIRGHVISAGMVGCFAIGLAQSAFMVNQEG